MCREFNDAEPDRHAARYTGHSGKSDTVECERIPAGTPQSPTANPRRFQRKRLDVRDRHGIPHRTQPQARRELHRRGGVHRKADLRFRSQRSPARIRTLPRLHNGFPA